MTKFKSTRIESRQHWLIETKRKHKINDNTSASMECEWQIKYTKDDEHISIFCSIGEWGANLTDLLSDPRFDKYNFANEKYRKALFRNYTRIFLVSSEILTDFQDLIVYLKDYPDKKTQDKKKKARLLLSDKNLPFTFNELMDFINHICKHKFGEGNKTNKYHLCNHHIQYEFQDSEVFVTNANNLSINNLLHTDNTKIEIPRLKDIINQILYCYKKLDAVLEDREIDTKSKLKPFTQTIT